MFSLKFKIFLSSYLPKKKKKVLSPFLRYKDRIEILHTLCYLCSHWNPTNFKKKDTKHSQCHQFGWVLGIWHITDFNSCSLVCSCTNLRQRLSRPPWWKHCVIIVITMLISLTNSAQFSWSLVSLNEELSRRDLAADRRECVLYDDFEMKEFPKGFSTMTNIFSTQK